MISNSRAVSCLVADYKSTAISWVVITVSCVREVAELCTFGL